MAKNETQAKAAASPKGGETAKTEKSASTETPTKTEGGETSGAAPANYSRGEGQKPVSQAYRDNWNLIFRKNKSKR